MLLISLLRALAVTSKQLVHKKEVDVKKEKEQQKTLLNNDVEFEKHVTRVIMGE